MRSLLSVSLILVLVAGMASAGFYPADTVAGIYTRSGALVNENGAGSARIGKDDGDGRMAGFWNEASQAAIAAEIAAINAQPGKYAVVKVELTGAYGSAEPTREFAFEAFKTSSAVDAATVCWEYASVVAFPPANNGWLKSDGSPVPAANHDETVEHPWSAKLTEGFWGLDEKVVNSNKIIGYVPSTGPTDLYGMGAELDAATLAYFLSDEFAGNLRFISSQWGNNQAYMPAQWGGIAKMRLAVYEVPEPATLALLAFGGLAAIRRRK